MPDNQILFNKFKGFQKRFQFLENQMVDPKVIKDIALYRKMAKERASLCERIKKFQEIEKVGKEIARLEIMAEEAKEEKEFLELVDSELESLRKKYEDIYGELEEFLIEKDPRGSKDIIVEIRAGTGGEEAALFVADLYRMYTHYADKFGFKVEIINSNPTPIGGFKEIIFSVEGVGAFSRFKFESGVHRVQRVPSTEASGRIHTSAVSVAVFPEAEETEIEINLQELKIDVYRSTGAGGQSVNTTDSAVRITHMPSGIVVTCQDERSQIKNKAKAFKVLRARLLDKAQKDKESKIKQERRMQIGSGDRSEKIRTYNFPDRRVTDHRIGITLYKIEQILEGELDELIAHLAEAEKKLKLNNAE
ncbi:MAG: peptide chain release factor 1 [Candidatus Omnitrophica bacterium]|nr:peptide chain release factor 1 [Candidatus Omnitrophota bacterium]